MPKTEFKPVKNIENDILKIIQKSIEEYIDGSVGENLSLKEFFNAGKTAKEIADEIIMLGQKTIVPKTEFKPVKSAEEILLKHLSNEKLYSKSDIEHNKDILTAMEEYASQFKTDLREELKKFFRWLREEDYLQYHLQDRKVDEYLKTKQ